LLRQQGHKAIETFGGNAVTDDVHSGGWSLPPSVRSPQSGVWRSLERLKLFAAAV
jgi:hypothetical protein